MTDYAALRTQMVDSQIRPSDVTKFPIIEAMLAVPRELFVPQDRKAAAYLGENISLGGSRVMLEPRTLGKMLDALDIQAEDLVEVIGAAQGYTAAVVSRMAEAVVAVEEDSELCGDSQQLLNDLGADNVVLHEAKLSEGAPEHGPYDVILLEGAVEFMPEAILDQLKEGGRIAALFSEDHLGVVRIGYKMDGKVSWRFAFNAGAPVLPGFERHSAFTL